MLQHRTFVPPTPFVLDDLQDLSAKEKDEFFAGIAAASKDEFDQAMKTQNTNDAWSSLAKIGEKLHALSKSSKTRQFGRNKPPRFKTVNVASHAISSKQADVPQRCQI